MSELTVKVSFSTKKYFHILQIQFKELFLKALSKIPGSPGETFIFACMGAMFVFWQVFVLNFFSGMVSLMEISLIGFQICIIVVLFTKLSLWFRMQHNEKGDA